MQLRTLEPSDKYLTRCVKAPALLFAKPEIKKIIKKLLNLTTLLFPEDLKFLKTLRKFYIKQQKNVWLFHQNISKRIF